VSKSFLPAAVLALVAVTIAACGSSSNSSSNSTASASSSTTTSAAAKLPAGVLAATGKGAPYLPGPGTGKGIGPMTGTPEGDKATAAGTAEGKKLGTVSNPPHPTVGFLDILGGIESADRATNSVRQALKAVGYKMLYCNGAGDPKKWTTCGNSLLSQNVKAIFLTGIDPSSIPSVVKKAKAQNVPILDCCGLVGPGFNAAFFPDEAEAGKVLSQALLAKLSGGGDVSVADYPAPWAKARTDELKSLVKGSDVKISASSVTDPTNLVQGTQKTVTDQLTANPGLKGLWFAFDTAGQAGAQVVAGKYPGKAFPDRPALFTFHADPSTQVLMRKGAVDEVVDVNYDVTAWEAVDALVEFMARKTALPDYSASATYPGIGNPLAYQIVTKDNQAPEGRRGAAPPGARRDEEQL
jgi:ABC-type sugar transport system substrate-binding protein